MTAAFGFTRRRRATRAPLWRVAWLHAVVAAAAALAATGCREPGPAPADVPPRSLLFISIDTLRADHLGFHGYPRRTSPNLDRFAADQGSDIRAASLRAARALGDVVSVVVDGALRVGP